MRNNYLWYQMFRHPIVGSGLRLFYTKIKVTGRENLPKNKPIIFVPNHQNSFMDALLVVCTVRPVIYFLTRAQAFKPKLQGWFLRSLNMLPVYRVRDGLSSVQKNNAIFEQCYDYLKRKDTVLVFAEANHDLKRRIRPLSKGFTRIAFGAEEKYDWNLDTQIVPVGVNYTEHREGRNTVRICYGDAIPVSKYRQDYLQDEHEATQDMKSDVAEAMKELVFHVPTLDQYPVNIILWDKLESNELTLTNPDIVNPRIQKTEKHITPDLTEEAKELLDLTDKHDVKIKDFTIGKNPGIKDVLLFPVYVFSLINNLIPYQAVRYLTTKVIKDHAFDASIKFLSGIVLLPTFYLLICLILGLSGVEGELLAAYFLISFFSAPFFIRAKELFTPNPAKRLKKSSPDVYDKIRSGIEKFKELRVAILSE